MLKGSWSDWKHGDSYCAFGPCTLRKHIQSFLDDWRDLCNYYTKIGTLGAPVNYRAHPDIDTSSTLDQVALEAAMAPVHYSRQVPRNPRRQTLLPILLERKVAGRVTRRYLEALPDTGADENAMDWNTCKSLGVDLDRRPAACKQFTTANGRPFWSIGQIDTNCSFALGKDMTQSSVRFNVFSNLAAPLILGQDFLEETKTMNLHWDRLIEKSNEKASLMRVLHMSRPSRRLQCSVDGLDVFARADTGSDVNLVSQQFVLKSHRMLPGFTKENLHVQFADGSTDFISTSFGGSLFIDGREATSNLRTRFYVLSGLTSDVLLGEAVLQEANVFMKHLDSFADIFTGDPQLSLNFIKWLTKKESRLVNAFKRKRLSAPDSIVASSPMSDARLSQREFRSALADADARELYRREQAANRISRLTAPEQAAADDLERAKAAEYDNERTRSVTLREQRLATHRP